MNTTGDQSHKSGKGNPDLREHPSSYGLKVIDLQINQGGQGNPSSLWEHPAYDGLLYSISSEKI